MDNMGHVFISYKTEDYCIACDIRDHVKSWGYSTWLYQDNAPKNDVVAANHDWQQYIDKALKSSSAVIAIVTSSAVNSHYVTAEWDIAIVKLKPFIPLLYEAVNMPLKYSRLHPIDFTDRQTEPKNLREQLSRRISQPIPTIDPFYEYLNKLFDEISIELGHLIIKGRSTYGEKGRVAGEPIHLQVKLDSSEVIYEFDEAFDKSGKRAILLSQAGGGKTITWLNYVKDSIVKRVLDDNKHLPIRAKIKSWDSDNEIEFSVWLQSQNSFQSLDSIIKNGKALLLLDGLDELGKQRKNKNTDQLYDPRQSFIKCLPPVNELLITCRTEDYSDLAMKLQTLPIISLQLLSKSQIQEYLTRKNEVQIAIEEDEKLQSMLRTPLLLSFFAFAYEDMNAEERKSFQQLKNDGDIRDKIFEQYVTKRYNHEKENQSIEMNLKSICQALGQIAMENKANETSIDNTFHQGQFSRLLRTLGQERISNFIELVSKLHLLEAGQVHELDNSQMYHFIHSLLRDYFAYNFALDHLYDEKAYTFSNPAEALAELNDKRAVRYLINALESKDELIHFSAAFALAKFHQYGVYETLITALSHQDMYYRNRAATALGNLGRRSAIKTLIKSLHDIDPSVRSNAAYSLGKLRAKSAIKPLIRLLDDTSGYFVSVCYVVAEALEQIGTSQALAAIVPWWVNRLSNTERWGNKRFCDFAAEALERIGTSEALVAVAEWRKTEDLLP